MMQIAGVEVSPDHPCRTVCEISCNHMGSKDRALKLITAAKEAGADLVKFQCYTPDELIMLRGDGPASDPWGSDGWTMRQLYERAQTPHAWFPDLVAHAYWIGMPWFSSVFGLASLSLLEELGCPAYKIAALDRNSPMLSAALLTNKPTIVSRRGILEARRSEDITLYCPPGYPQAPGQIAWSLLRGLCPRRDGFSYHGTDPEVASRAAKHGATVIEAHLHLRDEPSELEADIALDECQFKHMVRMIRRASKKVHDFEVVQGP